MSNANRCLSWIIAVATLLLGVGALAQSPLTSEEVIIALEKNTITQHEPVIVDIRIQSPPETSLDFDPGYDWDNVQIKIVDPRGRFSVRPPEVLQEGTRFSKAVHIDAGAADTISLVANDWFRFEDLGLYQIEVVLRRTSSMPSDVSANLSLHVERRNEDALKATCSGLLARVNNSQSFSASLVAAKALSDITDSAAVPFMAAAMKKREFVSLMIGALARLNTEDAVNALTRASQSPDPETSNLARSAVASLRRVTEH